MRKAVLAVLALQLVVTAGVLLALGTGAMPLGVRGEWEWLRIPRSAAPTAMHWVIGGVAILGYSAYAGAGMRWLGPVPGRARELGAVASLFVVSAVIQVLIATAAPEGYGLAKWILALHNPGANGYYTVAKTQIGDSWRFLADYPNWIQRQGSLHIGTHPPGLFLLQRGLLHAMEADPAAARLVLALQPSAVEDAFKAVEQYSHLSRADRAALALTGALTLLLCAATVVPLYALARATLPANAAWAAACFWPILPAAILFQPTADTAFPALATTALALAVHARFGSLRRRLLMSAGAGVVLALGMAFSLVFLAIGLIVAALILTEPDRSTSLRRRAAALGATGVGFLVPTLLGWLVTSSNPFATWWWNQRNHARFYVEYPRTYLAWVVANPVELAVALGLPATLWILTGVSRWRTAPRVSLVTLLVLLILTLGGRSLSEVARLWLPMMPALLVAAGAGLTRLGGDRVALGVSIALVGFQTLVLQAMIQCVYPT